ncbi:MAG: POTRA domain-containing protein, partial [Rhodobacterales bacterium]
MLRLRKIIAICSLIVISNFFLTSYDVKADTSFTSIEVNGNYRIETATILSVADTPLNVPLSDSDVNGSLQRLMSSKLFEKVEFEIDNSVLKIAVKEFPTINEISIEGNKQLTDEQLIKLISSKPLKVYSTALATSDAEKLANAYSSVGRITAEVKPFIIRRSDNRIDLVFEVFEGQVIEVTRLSFIGNRNFSDRRLRRVLQTKQAGLLRKFRSNDTFAEDRIELDKQLLRDFYSSRGYIDFKVLSATSVLTRQRDGFFVTFKLDEGFSYALGGISVSSNLPGIKSESFSKIINLKSGATFSPIHIDMAISRAEKLASDKGFNFIRVDPIVDRNDATRTLDVTFN